MTCDLPGVRQDTIIAYTDCGNCSDAELAAGIAAGRFRQQGAFGSLTPMTLTGQSLQTADFSLRPVLSADGLSGTFVLTLYRRNFFGAHHFTLTVHTAGDPERGLAPGERVLRFHLYLYGSCRPYLATAFSEYRLAAHPYVDEELRIEGAGSPTGLSVTFAKFDGSGLDIRSQTDGTTGERSWKLVGAPAETGAFGAVLALSGGAWGSLPAARAAQALVRGIYADYYQAGHLVTLLPQVPLAPPNGHFALYGARLRPTPGEDWSGKFTFSSGVWRRCLSFSDSGSDRTVELEVRRQTDGSWELRQREYYADFSTLPAFTVIATCPRLAVGDFVAATPPLAGWSDQLRAVGDSRFFLPGLGVFSTVQLTDDTERTLTLFQGGSGRFWYDENGVFQFRFADGSVGAAELAGQLTTPQQAGIPYYPVRQGDAFCPAEIAAGGRGGMAGFSGGDTALLLRCGQVGGRRYARYPLTRLIPPALGSAVTVTVRHQVSGASEHGELYRYDSSGVFRVVTPRNGIFGSMREFSADKTRQWGTVEYSGIRQEISAGFPLAGHLMGEHGDVSGFMGLDTVSATGSPVSSGEVRSFSHRNETAASTVTYVSNGALTVQPLSSSTVVASTGSAQNFVAGCSALSGGADCYCHFGQADSGNLRGRRDACDVFLSAAGDLDSRVSHTVYNNSGTVSSWESHESSRLTVNAAGAQIDSAFVRLTALAPDVVVNSCSETHQLDESVHAGVFYRSGNLTLQQISGNAWNYNMPETIERRNLSVSASFFGSVVATDLGTTGSYSYCRSAMHNTSASSCRYASGTVFDQDLKLTSSAGGIEYGSASWTASGGVFSRGVTDLIIVSGAVSTVIPGWSSSGSANAAELHQQYRSDWAACVSACADVSAQLEAWSVRPADRQYHEFVCYSSGGTAWRREEFAAENTP